MIAVVLTSNVRLLDAPGNVLVPAQVAGLPRDSVANVSQVITLARSDLQELSGSLDAATLRRVPALRRCVAAVLAP